MSGRSWRERRGRPLQLVRRAVLASMVGLALGVLTVVVDGALSARLPPWLAFPAENGRVFVGTLIGATVTVAVFSLWMRTVMVGLIANELSPRLVSTYLEDGFQERMVSVMLSALGLATVVMVTMPGSGDQLPLVGVATTAVAGLGAVTAVLIAIHDAVRSLSVSQVIRDLTDVILAEVEGLPARGTASQDPLPIPDHVEDGWPVASSRLGWVSDVDADRMAVGLPARATATLMVTPGTFVAPGDVLAYVAAEEPPDDDLESGVVVEAALTPDATISLAIDQLVDVIHHAMLTTQNDSVTAQEGFEHLVAIIEALLRRDPPRRTFVGTEGRTVVTAPEPGVSDHVARLFRRLREGAASNVGAASSTLSTMGRLRGAAVRAGDSPTLYILDHEAGALVDSLERSGRLPQSEIEELQRIGDQLGLPVR